MANFALTRGTDMDHPHKVLHARAEMGSVSEGCNAAHAGFPSLKTKALSLQPNVLSCDGRFLLKAVSSFFFSFPRLQIENGFLSQNHI